MTDTTLTFALALGLVALGYFLRGTSERRWCKSHASPATKSDLQEMEKRMAKTQAQLQLEVQAATEQVAKVGGETRTLLTRVEELLAQLEDTGNATPELEAAVTALKEQVQVVDDLVPDAPADQTTTPA